MSAERITAERRAAFDAALDEVLAALPADVRELLDEVPLVVDDRPSKEMMRKLGVERPEYLRGLYTGVPLTRRSVHHAVRLPDVVQIYRLGVLAASTDRGGRLRKGRLRRQIRTTLLHEIGHHFGMSEQDLRRLGYG
jgi:predicted Zn-dependent protease with MMP-like domain